MLTTLKHEIPFEASVKERSTTIRGVCRILF